MTCILERPIYRKYISGMKFRVPFRSSLSSLGYEHPRRRKVREFYEATSPMKETYRIDKNIENIQLKILPRYSYER